MNKQSNFCRLLEIEIPIIQAPMAGGVTSPALVAAVSNAGGLGSLGAAYLSPEQLRRTIGEIRALTDKPFAVNLFAINSEPLGKPDIDPMLEILSPYYRSLNVNLPDPNALCSKDLFCDQVEVVFEAHVPVLSFTFGFPSAEIITQAKQRGIYLIGTATTVKEAKVLQSAGVDAIVAQGFEAGGHRGTFIGSFEKAMVGTMALVPQVVDAVELPVIAAGGIMDGRGIVAARALGASAVQMGTAFLVADEATVPTVYKQSVQEAKDNSTVITRAFSGRPARGIENEFIDHMERVSPEAILPYPLQNELTKPLRAAASKQGDPRYLSMWAGQAASLAHGGSAQEIIAALEKSVHETMHSLMADPWTNKG